MPLVVMLGLSLIGYRATVHVGDELGEQVKSALPYVAAAGVVYFMFRGRR